MVREASLTFFKLSVEELQGSAPLSSSEEVIYHESTSVTELVKAFLQMDTSLYPTPFDIEILISPSFNNLYV